MRRLACVLLLLFSVHCTSDDPTEQPTFFPLVFSNLTEAEALNVSNPGTLVFRDEASWQAFWQANANLGAPLPVIDFTDEMLIAVFWGNGYSGCQNFVNAIQEVQVRVDGVNTLGVVEVNIGVLPMLGGCITPVTPLQVIVVDTTITSVEFIGFVP